MDNMVLGEILKGNAFPCAFILMDALEENARRMLERGSPLPIRVATKSIRCLALLKHIQHLDPRFSGLMTYSARETAWLASEGFSDLLLAYPTASGADAQLLAKAALQATGLRVVADLPQHLGLLQNAAEEAGVNLKICMDVDMSTALPGLWFGVRRSGIRTAEAALRFADTVKKHPNLTLDSVMGYEAQIAGLQDSVRGRFIKNRLIRLLKHYSIGQLAKRRAQVVDALRQGGHAIELVNAGGTGSLNSSKAEAAVTELAAGSGFFQPHLFDGYAHFKQLPAAGYAIQVTRNPAPGIFTAAGGGYPASGQAGPSRLPVIWFPEGAKNLEQEGAGEVQTPFAYNGKLRLKVGDLLILRHAKAGEMLERFNSVALIRENRQVGVVPTYRGLGHHFL